MDITALALMVEASYILFASLAGGVILGTVYSIIFGSI